MIGGIETRRLGINDTPVFVAHDILGHLHFAYADGNGGNNWRRRNDDPRRTVISKTGICDVDGRHLSVGDDDWIGTFALNSLIPNPTTMGLPAVGTSDDETYQVAAYYPVLATTRTSQKTAFTVRFATLPTSALPS
jgi:hypothetical protein